MASVWIGLLTLAMILVIVFFWKQFTGRTIAL